MPWKTKEDGGLETQELDGSAHPVWIKDDGTEEPFDASRALGTIARLTSENKDRRTKAEELAAQLSPYEGLDAEAARKALETVQNLDDKKLIAAGEVDRVKAEVREAYEKKLEAEVKKVEERDGRIRNLLVSQRFGASDFFSGKDAKTLLLPDVAEAYFGRHFRVEGDKVVAYKDAGTYKDQIYSEKNPGEPADFDEAIGFLVNSHPHKDRLLAGSGASGSSAPTDGHRPRDGSEDTSKLPPVVRLQKAFEKTAAAS